MKVTSVLLPFRTFQTLESLETLRAFQTVQTLQPLCRSLLPDRLAGVSMTLLKATALDLAILAGHLLLYPSGIVQERRPTTPAAPRGAPGSIPAPTPIPTTTSITGTTGTSTPTGDHTPAPTRLPTAPRPPVILLHGFIDNRSVFVLLRRYLTQHGRRQVVSLNYSPLTGDIRAAAELLGRHIEALCERTGSDQVDIVGHSLGGLIARYYAQRLGGDLRVRTLVTLGTPHSGTRVVPLADAHPIVRQMRPGSEVIEELAFPAPGCRTRFVSFWSDLDHLMDPLETARVDHPDLLADNVRVSGIGHLALPVHPAVAHRIRQALDSPPPGTGTGAHAGASGGLTVA
ncbi:alpha/beta fold hydrolase [Streptomyces sp. NPDC093252]|uniref:esterase/lipase family protein n=1 Tax=Streptomyces sp. NPDC093252 TaxID=3154980 RepID=UPI003441056C